eukprot:TRINITY_DN38586_c0_g1_i1.p1 TRINITY_DN38586_c0_g1~~TRINITY_DN38586_c0_g1_i1.p1  ORF type:complete len:973 (+),score=147.02 TRINITY_DN38586_c0_g1_i1:69-2987(+)
MAAEEAYAEGQILLDDVRADAHAVEDDDSDGDVVRDEFINLATEFSMTRFAPNRKRFPNESESTSLECVEPAPQRPFKNDATKLANNISGGQMDHDAVPSIGTWLATGTTSTASTNDTATTMDSSCKFVRVHTRSRSRGADAGETVEVGGAIRKRRTTRGPVAEELVASAVAIARAFCDMDGADKLDEEVVDKIETTETDVDVDAELDLVESVCAFASWGQVTTANTDQAAEFADDNRPYSTVGVGGASTVGDDVGSCDSDSCIAEQVQRAVMGVLAADVAGSDVTPWRAVLDATPQEDIANAARCLWRIGAIAQCEPRHAPRMTCLGRWLAGRPLPPEFTNALLHAAWWGVLLPMAALVVLVDSAPSVILNDGSSASFQPRRSGHFALASAYFRWRDGHCPGFFSGALATRQFWDVAEERIVAICHHAKHLLGYNGKDVSILSEVSHAEQHKSRDKGRGWFSRRRQTLINAFGLEGSVRWARFCAALCAAFPPSPVDDCASTWVGVTATLKTVVSSPHAVLFAVASSQTRVGAAAGTCELEGIGGSLGGGEGALDEALALRHALSEMAAERLCCPGQTAATMDAGLQKRVLTFLWSSSSEFVAHSGQPRTAGPGGPGCEFLAYLRCPSREINAEVAAVDTSSAMVPSQHASLLSPRLLPSHPESWQSIVACNDTKTTKTSRPAPFVTVGSGEVATEQGRENDRGVVACIDVDSTDTGDVGLSIRDSELGHQRRSTSPSPSHCASGLAAGAPSSAATSTPAVFDAALVENVPLDKWAAALARLFLLRALKRRAVEAEDFNTAKLLKVKEIASERNLVGDRAAALEDWSRQRTRALRRLRLRKQRAVETEDFELAARLKLRLTSLEATPSPPPPGDLEMFSSGSFPTSLAGKDRTHARNLRNNLSPQEMIWWRLEGLAASQAARIAAQQQDYYGKSSCGLPLLCQDVAGIDVTAWAEAETALGLLVACVGDGG